MADTEVARLLEHMSEQLTEIHLELMKVRFETQRIARSTEKSEPKTQLRGLDDVYNILSEISGKLNQAPGEISTSLGGYSRTTLEDVRLAVAAVEEALSNS
ncbi:MAG TPA: hypothetical protein VF552_15600 [Allosphingosinicella sp.]